VGAVVTVADHSLEGHQLIEVHWEGRVVLMFGNDILVNGTLVTD
jgi:hypothetical protein